MTTTTTTTTNATSPSPLLLGGLLAVLATGCQPTARPTATPAPGAGSDRAAAPDTTDARLEPMKVSEQGRGRTILILHGGGGPATMTALAAHLAETAHVVMPTYPGWDGTPRPASLHTVAGLADQIVRYLDDHDAKDVLVIGSSIGGWVGAEVALRDLGHRITGLVIIDGIGVDVPGQPVTNVTGFTPQQLARVAYHDPSKLGAGAPPPTPERIAMMRGNAATLVVFAGDPYGTDPTLKDRLAALRVPSLAVWGESDHVVTPAYGRAYAAAIPNARFESIAEAGHLPWIEQPAATFAVLDRFIAATAGPAGR